MSEPLPEASAASASPPALAALIGLVEAVGTGTLSAEHFGRVPPPEGGRASAVLVLFGHQGDRIEVVLTERASGLRSHAGQAAFPGGACDPGDVDVTATALREAHEEIGLDVSGVDIVGTLPALHIPPSGFVVTPVLAWWRRPSPVSAVDPGEVAAVHHVALADLVDPARRLRVRHPSGYDGPAFRLPASSGSLLVWGFTAMVLDRVIALAGWEQPWSAWSVWPAWSGLPE